METLLITTMMKKLVKTVLKSEVQMREKSRSKKSVDCECRKSEVNSQERKERRASLREQKNNKSHCKLEVRKEEEKRTGGDNINSFR